VPELASGFEVIQLTAGRENGHCSQIQRYGRALVLLGSDEVGAGPRDVVYVPGNEVHQFRALGDEPLGFLCVIPAL
jgi:oxalate decarboxylase/phosphoglucose isomerase-like protein (cupin superfamily)